MSRLARLLLGVGEERQRFADLLRIALAPGRQHDARAGARGELEAENVFEHGEAVAHAAARDAELFRRLPDGAETRQRLERNQGVGGRNARLHRVQDFHLETANISHRRRFTDYDNPSITTSRSVGDEPTTSAR